MTRRRLSFQVFAIYVAISLLLPALPRIGLGTDTVRDFDKLATELKFFGFSELLSDRVDIYLVREQELIDYRQRIVDFKNRNDTVAELISLLKPLRRR